MLVEYYTSSDKRKSEHCRQRLSTHALKELNRYRELHDVKREYVVATIADTIYGVNR